MQVQIAVDEIELAKLCRRHHIRKLAVFGSGLRDDFGPDSDVDVLVEFEPGCTPAFGFFAIQEELAMLFERSVDLVTRGFLSPYIRNRVEEAAHPLYDAD